MSDAPIQILAGLKARRAAARRDLRFEFVPLAGNGSPVTLSMEDFGQTSVRGVAEELLIAFMDVTVDHSAAAARASFYGLCRFIEYLMSNNPEKMTGRPVRELSDITYETQAQYENWLRTQPAHAGRKTVDEHAAALRAFFATGSSIPVSKKRKCVHVMRLAEVTGVGPALRKYEALDRIAAEEAAARGLLYPGKVGNLRTGKNKPPIKPVMDVLSAYPTYDRTSINSWEDVEFKKAVVATGRKKLIMTALWTEACLPCAGRLEGRL